jgi:AraC family transcriptional regulator of adaptative response / DNA-3-methyladenine glycosylase II
MDADARYAALVARDRRYDGVFFVGVSTTGIYCRPICPAKTPGRTRCSFHDTAAHAEAAGFRACFRCRPELAPGNADVDAVDTLVATAAARITEGALNEASVDELAEELGVSARHLRRAMEARLGVSPIDLAQTRRLALAKQLLQDTGLSLTQIAFAAGFQSVRRFNAVFAEVMGSAPGALRRVHAEPVGETLALRLDYRTPYDFDQLLTFLAARAIPGVEHVEQGRYRRIVQQGGKLGTIEVRRDERRDALVLTISPSLISVLMRLVARVRSMFDLDARPDVIDGVLGKDPVLAKLVARRPGVRVPGAIDGFEAAVRALLGQQVSVAAATTLAGRFADRFGTPYDGGDRLTHRFPTAREVVAAGVERIAKIGLPGARAAALHGFAQTIDAKPELLESRDLERFVTAAVALPGIGPWTAHYLAMRALHLPDAFPAADLGILKALDRAKPRDAEARAEAWRPFRSYAVMHLWTSLGDTDGSNDDRITTRRPAPVREGRRARGGLSPGAGRTRGDRARDAGADANGAAARRVLRGRPQDVRAPDRSSR